VQVRMRVRACVRVRLCVCMRGVCVLAGGNFTRLL